MSESLIAHTEGSVLILTNNNPAARNALSPAYFEALCKNLAKAELSREISAVVLTGAEGNFCSGGDLTQLEARRTLSPADRRIALERLHVAIRAIRDCGKPVIAAVEGAAAGAGLSIALACDMLVSAKTANFLLAYVKVGLTPDGGVTALLAEFVSRQVLTELCLTGQRISGERMHALGAVNRLAETGQALQEALALAKTIASGPHRAMARIKALCRQAGNATLDQQLEYEARLMVESQGDAESGEGISAFFEKRPPDFIGLR